MSHVSEFKMLADDQLLTSLEQQFALERKTSHAILLHLKEVKLRRLHVERGYHDMFTMLIEHFHQSESAANQKLKALDLMLDVPVAEEKLISGELSLSTVAMAQRQIKREEKLTGKELSHKKKLEIVESISGKTMAQAEVELFKLLPETAGNPAPHERRVSETATQMTLTVPDDVRDMMIRLKELWAHIDPTMNHVEVMRRAFKMALEKIDPLAHKEAPKSNSGKTHSATESAKHRGTNRLTYYGKKFDRVLWERANARCEFVDHVSGRRCECRFGLQREHKIPLGRGGTNELKNMELLCAAHNQLRARQVFGNQKVEKYQSRARG